MFEIAVADTAHYFFNCLPGVTGHHFSKRSGRQAGCTDDFRDNCQVTHCHNAHTVDAGNLLQRLDYVDADPDALGLGIVRIRESLDDGVGNHHVRPVVPKPLRIFCRCEHSK